MIAVPYLGSVSPRGGYAARIQVGQRRRPARNTASIEPMIFVYRACRVSDMSTGIWGLLNYGLANYRGSGTEASFTTKGYTTAGVATTKSPQAAFYYACMGLNGAKQLALFALRCTDEAHQTGSVQLQAVGKVKGADGAPLAGFEQAFRSVEATEEVILPSVLKSDILGYYTVRQEGGLYDLDAWTAVQGSSQEQSAAQKLIEAHVSELKQSHGGQINQDVLLDLTDLFMGK